MFEPGILHSLDFQGKPKHPECQVRTPTSVVGVRVRQFSSPVSGVIRGNQSVMHKPWRAIRQVVPVRGYAAFGWRSL